MLIHYLALETKGTLVNFFIFSCIDTDLSGEVSEVDLCYKFLPVTCIYSIVAEDLTIPNDFETLLIALKASNSSLS